ncbi:MAG: alpha/beta hydrolase [Chloroflexota bacterium]
MAANVRRRRSLVWWLSRLVLAVAAGLGIALGIDIVRLGGPETWLIRHRLPPPYIATGMTLTVNGIATYLDCRGRGSPTVILESGLGTGAAGWGFVPDRLAATVRVCAWDRPGIGNSAPMGHHTAADLSAHLRATLAAAGERGPFVVVGHSLGGVYARVFAATYRDEVVGVALIDPYLPDVRPVEHVEMDPALRDAWLSDLASTNRLVATTEDLDWEATEMELAGASIDGLPLELVFVEQRFRWDARFDEVEAELIATWRSLVGSLSSDHRLTIAENSTHMIQWDRPELVVDAVRRLVAASGTSGGTVVATNDAQEPRQGGHRWPTGWTRASWHG